MDDLVSIGGRRGLFDEAAARRELGDAPATISHLLSKGYLKTEDVEPLLAAYHDTLRAGSAASARCGRCGRRMAREGDDIVCGPCGIRVTMMAAPRREEGLPPDVRAAAADPANVVGRYVKLREIGRGGFGAVWLAWDGQLSRHVALKFLKATHEEDLARFRREASLAAGLSHPNIAAVYEIGDAPPYIAMQLVDGAGADKTRPSAAEAARIVRAAAEAVQHAHERGVIHRDLKPQNVMVDKGGRVFVMDFGLAKRTDVESELSVSGSIVGTPAFMSPEQAAGHVNLDARTDVYGLGATLYALLSGGPPFKGGTFEVIRKVGGEEPPRLAVDRDLATIVARAMEKESARRYRTAGELGEDLGRYLAGEAIQARPASVAYRLRKRVARNPWGWGMGAAVLLVTAAAAAIFGWQSKRFALSREASDAVAQADRALVEWRSEQYFPLHDVTKARGRVAEAIAGLERALAIQPEAHPVWARLGRARLELGRTEAAIDALEKAISMDPGQGVYHWWLARACGRRGEEAHRARLAARDAAERAAALKFAAGIQRRQKECVDRALELGWSGEPWERRLADGWRRRHEPEGRAILRDVGESEPVGGEEAWMILGETEDDPRAAAECYDRATRKAPSCARAYVSASLAYQGAARSRIELEDSQAAAVDRAGKAVEIDRELGVAWSARGSARGNAAFRAASFGIDPTGVYRAILDDFTQAVRCDPRDGEAWKWRGQTQMKLGGWLLARGEDAEPAFAAAVRDFERAVQIAPSAAHGWIYLGGARNDWGVCVMNRGGDPTDFFRRAVEHDLARALAILPDSDAAFACRGNARRSWALHVEQGGGDPLPLYRAAIDEDFAKAVRFNPANAEAWRDFGDVRLALGHHLEERRGDPAAEYEAAAECFTKSIDLDPDDAAAWTSRGQARADLAGTLPDNAEPLLRRAVDEDLKRAVELNSSSIRARVVKAEALSRWGDLLAGRGDDFEPPFVRAVEEELAAALRVNADSIEALASRGAVRMRWGTWRGMSGMDPLALFDAAVDEDFARVTKLRPDDAGGWLRFGVALGTRALIRSDAEDLKRADEAFSRAVDLAPRLAEARRRRGQFRLMAGRPAEALADLQKAVDLDPAIEPELRDLIEGARRALDDP